MAVSCVLIADRSALADDIDWFTAQHVLQLSPCNGLSCAAAKDLKLVFDAMLHRDIPNTMDLIGGEATGKRLHDETQRMLNKLTYKNRERVPLYCTWLTKIAQHDPDVFAIYTGNTNNLIELAARLDTVDTTCLSDVINALPRTPDMDKIITDTQESCRLNYPNHHCAKIARPR